MEKQPITSLKSVRLAVAAPDFQAGLSFFVEELGFEVAMIAPAEDPTYAVLTLEGMTIALDKNRTSEPVTLEIPSEEQEIIGTSKQGPNGTKVHYVSYVREVSKNTKQIPVLNVAQVEKADWVTGRASMAYRSLIDDQKSHITASHIKIEGSGQVPDWVHFHDVEFQVIYCLRGSAKLVYEGQGEPFILSEGDCVLQPPHIRHRVLESYDDLEVIEVTSPSDHATYADRVMELPSRLYQPERDFSGQRFAFSKHSESKWVKYPSNENLVTQKTSILKASGGVGWVNEIRATAFQETNEESILVNYDFEPDFYLWFVLEGTATIIYEGRKINIGVDDAIICPNGCTQETEFYLAGFQEDFRVLEVGINPH